MKKIKLLVSDLDGTLLKNNSNEIINWSEAGVSSNNTQAVKKLLDNNIELAIATGRMSIQTFNVLKNIRWMDKYIISQNGVYIENTKHQIIKKSVFTPNQAKNLISWLLKHGFNPFFSSYDTIYINKNKLLSDSNIAVMHYLKNNSDNVTYKVIDFNTINYHELEISNFGLDASRISIEQMENLENYLNEQIDYAQFFITSENSFDMIPINVDKASAIVDLAKIKKLDLDEIAFVGDSSNDRPALQLLKHSFVIDHARYNVKIHASHVVHSVAECIDMIIEHNKKIK